MQAIFDDNPFFTKSATQSLENLDVNSNKDEIEYTITDSLKNLDFQGLSDNEEKETIMANHMLCFPQNNWNRKLYCRGLRTLEIPTREIHEHSPEILIYQVTYKLF